MQALREPDTDRSMTSAPRQLRRVLVWDAPTRVFHWLLVIATVTAFVTGFVLPQWWLDAHLSAGYTIIGLLVFRFIWAAFGSEYSRLGSFTYSPSETLGHVRGVLLLVLATISVTTRPALQ